MDNVFIEWLKKSVKYEDIYLKAYSTMTEAKKGLAGIFTFYNEKRWYHNFDKMTPAMVLLCQAIAETGCGMIIKQDSFPTYDSLLPVLRNPDHLSCPTAILDYP